MPPPFEKQEVGTSVSSAAPSTLNIYLGVQVRALENKRSLLLARVGMTRIPGVGRTSASPSLENKEEHERDVSLLSREDRDRWGAKLVTREMGTSFVSVGGKRMVTRGGVVSVQALEEGKCAATSPPFCSCLLWAVRPSPPHPFSVLGESQILGRALEGISFSSLLSTLSAFTKMPHKGQTRTRNRLQALPWKPRVHPMAPLVLAQLVCFADSEASQQPLSLSSFSSALTSPPSAVHW